MLIKYWDMTKLVLTVSSISNRATHFSLLNSGWTSILFEEGGCLHDIVVKVYASYHDSAKWVIAHFRPKYRVVVLSRSSPTKIYDHMSHLGFGRLTIKSIKDFGIYIDVVSVKITLILKLTLIRVIFFNIKCFVCMVFHTSMCMRIGICIGQFPLIPQSQPFSMIVMEHVWT